MEARRVPEKCQTILSSGIWSSANTQLVKYVDHPVVATTGETIWSTGKNGLPPLGVIDQAYIYENVDVNLSPCGTFGSVFNPLNWIAIAASWVQNYRNGVQIIPAATPGPESVKFHAINLDKVSAGGLLDIEQLYQHYLKWLNEPDRTPGLILYGVSRGTATTFCAMAKYKFPEVKLVILEGAIDSIPNVVTNIVASIIRSKSLAEKVVNAVSPLFSFFTAYKPDDISPLSCVDEYPANVPTVFITSETDTVVHCENTERIAQALADKGQNDVYLLKLRSPHPDYMYNNLKDHETYKAFIHAIYARYNLQHKEEWAQRGEPLLETCRVKSRNMKESNVRMCA